jgi:hypothetical protein
MRDAPIFFLSSTTARTQLDPENADKQPLALTYRMLASSAHWNQNLKTEALALAWVGKSNSISGGFSFGPLKPVRHGLDEQGSCSISL